MPITSVPALDLVDPLDRSLQRTLVDEMRAESPTPGGPTIVTTDAGGPYGYRHLYVVWSDPSWASLDRLRRSEIALDAYESVAGVDEALKVTQCWGLTPDEAEQQGLRVPTDIDSD